MTDVVTIAESPDSITVIVLTTMLEVILTEEVLSVGTEIDIINVSDAADTIQPQFDAIVYGAKGDKGDTGESGAVASTLIAGETMNSTVPAMLDGSGTVFIADNTNPAHAGLVIGITAQAATIGNVIDINQGGKLSSVTWTWVAGPIYVGAGVLTQTLPVTGFIQQVAVALSATEIIVDVQMAIAR